MYIKYKQCDINDIPILIEERICLLQIANNIQDRKTLHTIETQLYQYYVETLKTKEHIAYLASENDIYVGTGGISFYRVMPTYHNPTGQRAYIVNMYTNPLYRNRGIATHILDCLVKKSLEMGIQYISLEATEAGRSLYKNYGFADLTSEMQLKNETFDLMQNQ